MSWKSSRGSDSGTEELYKVDATVRMIPRLCLDTLYNIGINQDALLIYFWFQGDHLYHTSLKYTIFLEEANFLNDVLQADYLSTNVRTGISSIANDCAELVIGQLGKSSKSISYSLAMTFLDLSPKRNKFTSLFDLVDSQPRKLPHSSTAYS